MVEESENFVRVLVDADLETSGPALQQLGVHGFPTVIFMDVKNGQDVTKEKLKSRSPEDVLSQMKAFRKRKEGLSWTIWIVAGSAALIGVFVWLFRRFGTE